MPIRHRHRLERNLSGSATGTPSVLWVSVFEQFLQKQGDRIRIGGYLAVLGFAGAEMAAETY